MIEVLAPMLAATSAAIFVALAMRGERTRLESEVDRLSTHTDRLLNLLMSRSAPAEFAAYIDPPASEPGTEWLSSEDGLVTVPLDPDEL